MVRERGRKENSCCKIGSPSQERRGRRIKGPPHPASLGQKRKDKKITKTKGVGGPQAEKRQEDDYDSLIIVLVREKRGDDREKKGRRGIEGELWFP